VWGALELHPIRNNYSPRYVFKSVSENWQPVPGYEGLYEVSDLGHVRSFPRVTRSGVRGGKILKPYPRRDGYLEVYLYKEPRRKVSKIVHRLVLEAFIGPCPEGHEALHGGNSKTDNRLENLKWGTRSQNMGEDRVRDKQSNRGERSGHAKLTWSDVCEIRKLVSEGESQHTLAKRYGIAVQTLNAAVLYKTWRYPPAQWRCPC